MVITLLVNKIIIEIYSTPVINTMFVVLNDKYKLLLPFMYKLTLIPKFILILLLMKSFAKLMNNNYYIYALLILNGLNNNFYNITLMNLLFTFLFFVIISGLIYFRLISLMNLNIYLFFDYLKSFYILFLFYVIFNLVKIFNVCLSKIFIFALIIIKMILVFMYLNNHISMYKNGIILFNNMFSITVNSGLFLYLIYFYYCPMIFM